MRRTARHRFRPTLEDCLETRTVLSTVVPEVAELTAQVVSAQVVSPTRISQRTLNTVNKGIDWAFQRYRDGNPSGSVLSYFDNLFKDWQNNGTPQSPDNNERGDYNLLMKRIAPNLARLPNGYNALYPAIVNKATPRVLKPSNAPFFRDWLKTQIRQYVRAGVRDHRFVVTAR